MTELNNQTSKMLRLDMGPARISTTVDPSGSLVGTLAEASPADGREQKRGPMLVPDLNQYRKHYPCPETDAPEGYRPADRANQPRRFTGFFVQRMVGSKTQNPTLVQLALRETIDQRTKSLMGPDYLACRKHLRLGLDERSVKSLFAKAFSESVSWWDALAAKRHAHLMAEGERVVGQNPSEILGWATNPVLSKVLGPTLKEHDIRYAPKTPAEDIVIEPGMIYTGFTRQMPGAELQAQEVALVSRGWLQQEVQRMRDGSTAQYGPARERAEAVLQAFEVDFRYPTTRVDNRRGITIRDSLVHHQESLSYAKPGTVTMMALGVPIAPLEALAKEGWRARSCQPSFWDTLRNDFVSKDYSNLWGSLWHCSGPLQDKSWSAADLTGFNGGWFIESERWNRMARIYGYENIQALKRDLGFHDPAQLEDNSTKSHRVGEAGVSREELYGRFLMRRLEELADSLTVRTEKVGEGTWH